MSEPPPTRLPRRSATPGRQSMGTPKRTSVDPENSELEAFWAGALMRPRTKWARGPSWIGRRRHHDATTSPSPISMLPTSTLTSTKQGLAPAEVFNLRTQATPGRCCVCQIIDLGVENGVASAVLVVVFRIPCGRIGSFAVCVSGKTARGFFSRTLSSFDSSRRIARRRFSIRVMRPPRLCLLLVPCLGRARGLAGRPNRCIPS